MIMLKNVPLNIVILHDKWVRSTERVARIEKMLRAAKDKEYNCFTEYNDAMVEKGF